ALRRLALRSARAPESRTPPHDFGNSCRWSLYISNEARRFASALDRALRPRRASGVPLRRSRGSIARGERFLRTPGRWWLAKTPAPAGAGGLKISWLSLCSRKSPLSPAVREP